MALRGLACALVACVAAGAPAPATASVPATAPVRAAGATGPLGDERLSDERRLTRVAGTLTPDRVRSAPRSAARTIGRLHDLTEDGTPEVYPVLESRRDGGRTWLRIRLPGRPNGRTGWTPRDALGPFRVLTTELRVDRTTLRATLRRDGRPIWSSRIGVGARATPTPAGSFWIRSRLRGLAGNPAYGPFAFGTGAYSVLSDWPGGGVVGIHGTDQPARIPGRPSHGCVRVPNAAIRRLWPLLPVGTPVTIV